MQLEGRATREIHVHVVLKGAAVFKFSDNCILSSTAAFNYTFAGHASVTQAVGCSLPGGVDVYA